MGPDVSLPVSGARWDHWRFGQMGMWSADAVAEVRLPSSNGSTLVTVAGSGLMLHGKLRHA